MNTLINSYLSASGFVVECMRSVDDLRTVRPNTIHLALLDIDTAGGRLKEILEQMKSAGVPVIVLTSESDHAGRLSALELGQDLRHHFRFHRRKGSQAEVSGAQGGFLHQAPEPVQHQRGINKYKRGCFRTAPFIIQHCRRICTRRRALKLYSRCNGLSPFSDGL